MKKRIKIMFACALLGAGLCQISVFADGVEEKPYLSLGADLNKKERAAVLDLLGVDEADLDQYKVVTITNQDEHDYLDDYLSASVIGSRALSSVLIQKTQEGDGINVTTKNITYCTEGMYQNALSTAGVSDADVLVAGPFNITGTAALVGAMNAYEDMTGETITEESKDAATNELVLTGELATQFEDAEKAEQFLALVKEKVLSADIQNEADIKKLINESCGELNVELTEEQEQQISDLMEKIDKLDINVDDLKEQASQIYDKLSSLDVNSQGFFAKVKEILTNIYEAFVGLFQ